MKKLFFTIFLILMMAGCGEEEGSENGPEMRPGENCNSCHSFSVSGTVFKSPDAAASDGVSGAKITLTDSNGKVLSLTSNGAGNFYTGQSLSFPVKASVTFDGVEKKMVSEASSRACASCHSKPGRNGAPGRLFVSP